LQLKGKDTAAASPLVKGQKSISQAFDVVNFSLFFTNAALRLRELIIL
jgi:hypothetical protein